ncbi:putative regulator of Ras-like GTPase activity (Roadblock/LC7/MglB family) [Kitasatospora sp. MAP12-15]|uniref:CHAP domain-containing protein n=1 Tax=unclassified Kitasatospora TaxID=2633591 RepID=UPI002475E697|nr:CHAP domain-containing protein [Kitasatospora sp. MAP12-44]MDH6108627.1 putative regulator of Ras-like GTPase activity (Roadblock/LC7/MglB family) [Kitasatospora sp. MAP12-44]
MSLTIAKIKKSGIATLVAAAAVSGLTILPAHADAGSIANTALSQVGNGPCGQGGYQDGLNQSNPCSSSGTEAHAWCADFVGWVWAQNGVQHLSDLTDGAASVYDYGQHYGTLHSSPQVGDAVVYNYNPSADYADHVALVTAVGGGSITVVGGNEGHSHGYVNGIVQSESTGSYAIGDAPWGQTISGYISPITAATLNDTPSTLAAGTLVKSPDSATVKVIIGGAGIPLAGSDVAADGYNLGNITSVTDASFNALPATPPAGTVIKDESGKNASVYVVVGNSALPISGAEFSADGYNTKPLMGVPTSWLTSAAGTALSSGTVVYNQSGTDASRYVMVSGKAVPISGAEWTADGYNTRPLMGVPGTWLAGAAAATLPSGTVVQDQSGKSASIYVMVSGAALPISGAEWTADGYNTRPLMGVPGTWLAAAATTALPNGTVVYNENGTDAARYVMVGGAAVHISATEWTANGYNTRALMGVPGTWLAAAATALPADGTLVQAPGDVTVYLVTAGTKKALLASQFGAGGYSFSAVVQVPSELIAQLPTAS